MHSPASEHLPDVRVRRNRAQGPWPARSASIRLLDADPDLGAGLDPARFEAARARLVVRRLVPRASAWSDGALERVSSEGLGLIILKGILAREIALSDNVTTELVGAGDLIRPSHTEEPRRLLRASVRWTVIEAPELAVLGPAAESVLAEFPEIYAVLVDRLAGRAHRVSVAQAISQLNGVDRRVLTLFWHLAERWGRISGEGVVVPLAVPHRIVAQLVGARRPTVSTALGALVREGRLTRLPDGGWLLRGEPVGFPVGEASRVIRMRRRHFAPGVSHHTAEVGSSLSG